MKKFSNHLLKIVTLLLFLSSCQTDDSVDLGNELKGEWNLVNLSCYCPPSDLKKGDHIWEFDLNANEVSVQNLTSNPFQVLETGNYDINVTESIVMLQGVSYDYVFREGKLYLSDQPVVDGPVLEFER